MSCPLWRRSHWDPHSPRPTRAGAYGERARPLRTRRQIVDYHVQVDIDSTDFSSGMTLDAWLGTTDSKLLLDEANGVDFDYTYYFRVRAENGAGLVGEFSAVSPGIEFAAPFRRATVSAGLRDHLRRDLINRQIARVAVERFRV